ncbi:chascon isoform d-related [Anaeramoeba flamelloides]|uniref:Chascon isoform d-related n=1 Tax=Anaeramoeba flamelloides TaxID=1746091 RepID=A0AAV7YHN9_9EUKA|nr:chascon isoform d-related [Anaeramoeba flamelloides]
MKETIQSICERVLLFSKPENQLKNQPLPISVILKYYLNYELLNKDNIMIIKLLVDYLKQMIFFNRDHRKMLIWLLINIYRGIRLIIDYIIKNLNKFDNITSLNRITKFHIFGKNYQINRNFFVNLDSNNDNSGGGIGGGGSGTDDDHDDDDDYIDMDNVNNMKKKNIKKKKEKKKSNKTNDELHDYDSKDDIIIIFRDELCLLLESVIEKILETTYDYLEPRLIRVFLKLKKKKKKKILNKSKNLKYFVNPKIKPIFDVLIEFCKLAEIKNLSNEIASGLINNVLNFINVNLVDKWMQNTEYFTIESSLETKQSISEVMEWLERRGFNSIESQFIHLKHICDIIMMKDSILNDHQNNYQIIDLFKQSFNIFQIYNILSMVNTSNFDPKPISSSNLEKFNQFIIKKHLSKKIINSKQLKKNKQLTQNVKNNNGNNKTIEKNDNGKARRKENEKEKGKEKEKEKEKEKGNEKGKGKGKGKERGKEKEKEKEKGNKLEKEIESQLQLIRTEYRKIQTKINIPNRKIILIDFLDIQCEGIENIIIPEFIKKEF